MKKRCLTGIKSTGHLHIGNYLGAVKPALELANTNDDYESFFFVADYHALTASFNQEELKDAVYSVAAAWLACGLDPKKTHIYRQSDIPEILELNWILACACSKGLMNRAHSYKALTAKNEEENRDSDYGINMGLYTYPILMASDILAFESDIVPVGKDQLQHLEMARDMAQVFNNRYKKDVFKLPEAKIREDVGIIPGLDGRKMSSSYNNYISLFLPEKKLKKLINKIATDSSGPDEPKDPDTSVIFQLYTHFANDAQIESMRSEYASGIGWGHAKAALFDVMNEHLKGPREVYNDYMENPEKIETILKAGAEKIRPIATNFLAKVKAATGI